MSLNESRSGLTLPQKYIVPLSQTLQLRNKFSSIFLILLLKLNEQQYREPRETDTLEESVGYKNSKDRISEMDKLKCYRLGWVRLV